jgi:hypothetical protein
MGEDTPGTEEAKKIKKENDTTYNFLIQSVTGTAFPYVENANGHARTAWKNLCKQYKPEEEDLVDLESRSVKCILTNTQKDPEEWFDNIEYLNAQVEKISKQSKTSEIQLKAHVIANLPSEYSEVITASVVQSSEQSHKVPAHH